jgi:hypothetical protein
MLPIPSDILNKRKINLRDAPRTFMRQSKDNSGMNKAQTWTRRSSHQTILNSCRNSTRDSSSMEYDEIHTVLPHANKLLTICCTHYLQVLLASVRPQCTQLLDVV